MEGWLLILVIVVGGIIWLWIYAKNAKLKRITLEANLGDPNAQYELSRLYASGVAVEQDFEEAKKWLSKAAKQGHAESLGMLESFNDNESLPKQADYIKALKLHKEAAEQGNVESQYSLGLLYLGDRGGIQKDIMQACIWLILADTNGHKKAEDYLKIIYSVMPREEFDVVKITVDRMIKENPELTRIGRTI